MIDPFFQWIDVPDEHPALPPVDDDLYGLRDFSSLGTAINQESGLLLGPDVYHRVGADTFHPISLPPNYGQNASFSIHDPSPSYTYLFPPDLSPDSSPTSVASSPWPRTPETDALVNVGNYSPVGTLWDIAETEEAPCSTVHFLDQSGNSLDDVPSHFQDVRPEDLACTPQIMSNAQLSSKTSSLSNALTFVISPPSSASTSHQTEAVPLGQTTLSPSSPHTSPSLFGSSPYLGETWLPGRFSPSMSPLTPVSLLSPSPNVSPQASPLIHFAPLSPALPPVPLPSTDDKTDTVSSTPARPTLAKLRTKRNPGALDAPYWKMRRAKAKNVDEEEWSPDSERTKRPRAASSAQPTKETTTSIPQHPSDGSSDVATNRGSSDATPTTCALCGQGFTRMSDYIRHVQNSTSHPETRRVWPCPYCDKVLGRKDALGRHIKTLHQGKSVFIPEGVSEGQLNEGQRESLVQRVGQRKKRQLKRYR